MWTDEEVNYLRDLTEGAPRNTWKTWTKQMNKKFPTQRNWEQLRAYWRMNIRNVPAERKPEYKERYTKDTNGSTQTNNTTESPLNQWWLFS